METNLSYFDAFDCVSLENYALQTTFSCIYFTMFPFALLLNGVAVWVSLHLRSSSSFIVYLKNLVASDLILTFTIPIMAASTLPDASVGLQMFACRFSDVMFFNCMYMSIVLMGLISLDRFFKVVRPGGKLLGQNLQFSRLICGLFWVILYGVNVFPTIILTSHSPSNATDNLCLSLKGSAGLILHKVVVIFMDVLFWLVCIVIVICYICIFNKVLQSFRNSGSNNSQGKKKTNLRVFLVLVVFFLCFVPFHIIRIPFTLQEINKKDTCVVSWVDIANMITLCLSTSGVCMDPLLYVFLCREFREKLMDIIKRGVNLLKIGTTDTP